MRKRILMIFPLLFIFGGCEFIDLEWKKVPYNIKTLKKYVYSTKLGPGETTQDDVRYIQRSDFDIPETAFIKRFQLTYVYLELIDKDPNQCYDFKLKYTIEGPGLTGYYENDFIILDDQPKSTTWGITHEFTADIARIRSQIENAVLNNDRVKLSYSFQCNEVKSTDIDIIVHFEFFAEYINCEEVLFGTDLEDCGS